ncbi:MAG: terpene cyclase/mutase family protein [Planctomycetes bacterium]|nr:terpene cyclase/mutase family protein [Planctomycetota bacterium]
MLVNILIGLALCQQPSEKELFDNYLNSVRPAQMADGSYGKDLTITANVLIGMALSPRAYRVDDGPFMRDAVNFLLKHKDDNPSLAADIRVGMALVHVHRNLYLPSATKLAQRNGMTIDDLRSSTSVLKSQQLLNNLPQSASLSQIAAAVANSGLLRTYAVNGKVDDAGSNSNSHALQAVEDYERGVDYLLSSRGESGYWEIFGQPEPGITALAARGLLGSQRKEVRQQAYPILDWLISLQQPDGSIHGGRVMVYTTSVAIGALLDANRAADVEVIERAVAYLRAVQTDEGEGYTTDDKFYGGIGYGGDLRPDLSNLQYALQALNEADVPETDAAFQRAIYFINRSQNHSESNSETYFDKGSDKPARAGNDGGAAYYPGNSPAGYDPRPDGSLVARSYGSMTYALLKCYTFAGVKQNDARVEAALEWISDHYTLEVNPGFDPLIDPRGGFQGLYYYYQTLAQALHGLQIESITDVAGEQHDWRKELANKLHSVQLDNGSWVNSDAPRWWEGNPDLCTGYALSALKELRY